jgi:hypothetical protein
MILFVVQTHENTDGEPFFIWDCEELERALNQWGDEVVNTWVLYLGTDRMELLEWADINLSVPG